MLKIDNEYYIVQGYLNEYKLKIVKINNLEKFVKEILQYLTGNDIFTKKSNVIYKKYFKTDLKAYELGNSLIGKKCMI